MIEHKYFAISKDGLIYEDTDLEKLPKYNTILCYLKRYDKYEHNTGKNTYSWYRYELISTDGNPTKLKIGTCEVVFIEHDDGISYLRSRAFTIRDQYSREGKYILHGHSGDFGYHYLDDIAKKLVPFMLELSSYGGWDAYWSKNYPSSPQATRIVMA